jgi:hypothetical protein
VLMLIRCKLFFKEIAVEDQLGNIELVI